MNIVSIVIGSTRQGRFSEKPAKWIQERLSKREGVDVRLLDLRDFPMPFFDQATLPAIPGRAPYPDPNVRRWTEAIGESDGFIITTPEYNYGPPAVLKNAMDWVYPEWNRKAVAFCSWGAVNGARGVQQLRLVALELQVHPIRSSLHVPTPLLMEHMHGAPMGPGWADLEGHANTMFDELLWWTETLSQRRRAH